MGWTITGMWERAQIASTMGSSCTGPSEQLTPRAATPSPSSVITMESIPAPKKVRPPSSKLMVANTGRVQWSFTARSDALSS